MPRPTLTFSRFVVLPENRAACLAVQNLRADDELRLVMLHGPPGSGKTHLVQALVAQVQQERPDCVVKVLAAADLVRVEQPTLFATADDPGQSEPAALTASLEEARNADLLVVEDLQHLSLAAADMLVQVIDHLQALGRIVVVTGNAGPRQLVHRGQRFAARLTNRLAGGLVVALQALGAASRLTLLQTQAQRRQLAVPTAVLRWLADHLRPGRELEGAIARLETLAKTHRGALDVAAVAAAFEEQAGASRVTVERIAQRVGGFFQVQAGELQSRRRFRNVLLPRQVGMYLARLLTPLSLEQIGDYFGGRDHSTVLHAVRKVEEALEHDARLSGAVRQLHADLA
jgi:chromosomal replication initiator protein